jgi:hypothetical protein
MRFKLETQESDLYTKKLNMRNIRIILLTTALALFAACQSNTNRTGTSGSGSENEQNEQPVAKANYTCPMHPEVTSDHPGDCPKCGMDLVKSDSLDAAGSDTLAI